MYAASAGLRVANCNGRAVGDRPRLRLR